MQCFALKRGDVDTRTDVNYHALRETFTSGFPIVEIGTLTLGEPNYGLSARAVARTSDDEPRYIRITDFGDDGIEPGHKFVTAEGVEDGNELHPDDILFARSGSVGRTYIHEDTSQPAVFAGYCIRFRFDQSQVSPRFVYWWTKTEAYSKWVAAIQRTAAQPNINKEEYKGCLMPLPPLETQDALVDAMDAARAERRTKLAEADALLAGMDDFVTETVGITRPSSPRNTFALQTKDLTDAINPVRYQSWQIEKNLPFSNTVSVAGSLVESKFAPAKDAPDEQFDWIRIDDLPNQPWRVETVRTENGSDIAGALFEVQENDILIARLGPTILNAKFVLCPKLARRTVASGEFLVLRCNRNYQPEAVLWLLRTALYREMMYLRSRGTTPSRFRLSGDDLMSIPFPELDSEMQATIVEEVRQRREAARRLRGEADAGWVAAKGRFEVELLATTE